VIAVPVLSAAYGPEVIVRGRREAREFATFEAS